VADVQNIRDAMQAQPFRPFDLVLVDGTRCPVRHPDFVSIPPVRRPRHVLYYQLLDDPDETQSRFIDVNLIVEIAVPSDESIMDQWRQRPRPGSPTSPPGGG
jgi:hypothetical protein